MGGYGRGVFEQRLAVPSSRRQIKCGISWFSSVGYRNSDQQH
jgi:hypothetical protein